MSIGDHPTVNELAVEFLVQAVAKSSDLDREELRAETKQVLADAEAQLEESFADARAGMETEELDELCDHVLSLAETDWQELVDESREGAVHGSLADPASTLAIGAVAGFVILCAKIKRLDLAKKVVTFDPMPEGLATVLTRLIELVS